MGQCYVTKLGGGGNSAPSLEPDVMREIENAMAEALEGETMKRGTKMPMHKMPSGHMMPGKKHPGGKKK